jgi:pimeloyl-ACP methyl ester carboxylesterase
VVLLDVLGLHRVAVMAASGGGPTGYALGGRHPDRVACLLPIASIARPLPFSRVERLAFSSRPLVALQLWLVDRYPSRMMTMMGGTRPPDPDLTEAQARLLRDVIRSCGDWPRLRIGYDNDDAEFAALGGLPLAAITCPTLIVHGTDDPSVPVAHAEHAHAAIAGSQLRRIPGGRHLAFWMNPDVQRDALAFLLAHPGEQ